MGLKSKVSDNLQDCDHKYFNFFIKKTNNHNESTHIKPSIFGNYPWVRLCFLTLKRCILLALDKEFKKVSYFSLNVEENINGCTGDSVYYKGKWAEIFNSDSKEFWGTGDVYNPTIQSKLVDKASKCYQLKVHLPALGAVVLR